MVADQTVEIGGRVLRYCVHGPADGFPVIAHNGTPSTRWRRPDQIAVMHDSGVRVLMADRPGYGGSTRRPGRVVADVVDDVRVLADVQGWTGSPSSVARVAARMLWPAPRCCPSG